MLQVLAVWHVLVSMALVGLILMHSGRDAGLGGMGFTPAVGGRHAHRRAEPDPRDDRGGDHLRGRHHRALPLAVVALALAGCGSEPRAAPRLPVTGPAHTIRVALADVPWPLPPRTCNRDEAQLAEAVRAFRA